MTEFARCEEELCVCVWLCVCVCVCVCVRGVVPSRCVYHLCCCFVQVYVWDNVDAARASASAGADDLLAGLRRRKTLKCAPAFGGVLQIDWDARGRYLVAATANYQVWSDAHPTLLRELLSSLGLRFSVHLVFAILCLYPRRSQPLTSLLAAPFPPIPACAMWSGRARAACLVGQLWASGKFLLK
jgi:hypothetical protein